MNTSRLDLSSTPFVDNHAHALTRTQPRTPAEFRQHFSEAHSPIVAEEHIGSAVQFRWALRQLGRFLGVEPTEEAILAVRERTGIETYTRTLIAAAGTSAILLDEGFPSPDIGYSSAEMEAMLGIPVYRMLRIETAVQDLIARYAAWSELLTAFDEALASAQAQGYVALKSIAAYRTGLAIERVDEETARQAFEPLRHQAEKQGGIRLASKPLVDYFVWRAASFAAQHALPFQFHTGYGDPDLDLRLANPLHLRPLFEAPALADVPIVLLHASYPYTAEAAFLAAAYPNAYLDLAFSLPPLDRFELIRVLHIALGVAPASKLMCSSDGTAIPEHYWLGATRARECLGYVLHELIEADEIDAVEGERIGRMMLEENARRVYRLH